MIRRLLIGLSFVTLLSGCSQDPDDAPRNILPDSFDRSQYLSTYFDDLEDYCELLEHLYAQPDPDPVVVSEVERFVAGKLLLVRFDNFDYGELGSAQIDALLAVLRVSELEQFGAAWNNPLVVEPSLDILRRDRSLIEARREEILKNFRID